MVDAVDRGRAELDAVGERDVVGVGLVDRAGQTVADTSGWTSVTGSDVTVGWRSAGCRRRRPGRLGRVAPAPSVACSRRGSQIAGSSPWSPVRGRRAGRVGGAGVAEEVGRDARAAVVAGDRTGWSGAALGRRHRPHDEPAVHGPRAATPSGSRERHRSARAAGPGGWCRWCTPRRPRSRRREQLVARSRSPRRSRGSVLQRRRRLLAGEVVGARGPDGVDEAPAPPSAWYAAVLTRMTARRSGHDAVCSVAQVAATVAVPGAVVVVVGSVVVVVVLGGRGGRRRARRGRRRRRGRAGRRGDDGGSAAPSSPVRRRRRRTGRTGRSGGRGAIGSHGPRGDHQCHRRGSATPR